MVLQILRTMIQTKSDRRQASANRSSQARNIPQRRELLSMLFHLRARQILSCGFQRISVVQKRRIQLREHTKHRSGIPNVQHKVGSSSSRWSSPNARRVSYLVSRSTKRATPKLPRTHSRTGESFPSTGSSTSSLCFDLLSNEDVLCLFGLLYFAIGNDVCTFFRQSSTELHGHFYASIFAT